MAAKHQPEIYRTRLFLITPEDYDLETFAPLFEATLGAGDVASVLILPPQHGDYRETAERLVPIAQNAGAAALLYNDSQLMGRTAADGLHLDGETEEIVATVKAHAGREIMGVAGIQNRHEAMVMGEGPIDYLFFGRLNGDTLPDIFPKTFKLAEWWSSLFEVPAIVMGGETQESVRQAGDAGIDFVALRKAVWNADDPAKMVKECNDLLDDIYEKRLQEANETTHR